MTYTILTNYIFVRQDCVHRAGNDSHRVAPVFACYGLRMPHQPLNCAPGYVSIAPVTTYIALPQSLIVLFWTCCVGIELCADFDYHRLRHDF